MRYRYRRFALNINQLLDPNLEYYQVYIYTVRNHDGHEMGLSAWSSERCSRLQVPTRSLMLDAMSLLRKEMESERGTVPVGVY